MPEVKKPIDRVRAMMDVGVPAAEAIRLTLGGSIPTWAEERELARTPASMTINGKRVPPDARTLAALVEDLEATAPEVREILAIASQQAHLAAAS